MAQSASASAGAWRLVGSEIVPPRLVKELRRRTDREGLVYFAGHLAAQLATGAGIFFAQGTALIIPAVLLHGFVLSLWFAPMHECTHNTAFRTRWLNRWVGIVAGLFIWRPPLYFKYRHADHHTYTQHPQQDPDIVRMPASLREYFAVAIGLSFWSKLLTILVRSALGRFDAVERSFLPVEERVRVRDETRAFFAFYAAVVAASLAAGLGWELLLYWVIPRIAGEPFLRLIRIAEHTGAAESPNLLENTRTVIANPVLRFLFWNMPYHAEHHLLPSVPFHALPRLHEEVGGRLVHLSRGYWSVHRDLLVRMRAGRALGSRPA